MAVLFAGREAPRAIHLADCSGSLLMPNDPLYGRRSKQFLSWFTQEAERKGMAIGADDQLVRTKLFSGE